MSQLQNVTQLFISSPVNAPYKKVRERSVLLVSCERWRFFRLLLPARGRGGIQDSSRLMWPYPKSQNQIFLLAYARSDSGRGLRGMLPEARGCLLTQRRHLAPCRKRYTIPARQRYKIFCSTSSLFIEKMANHFHIFIA